MTGRVTLGARGRVTLGARGRFELAECVTLGALGTLDARVAVDGRGAGRVTLDERTPVGGRARFGRVTLEPPAAAASGR